LKIVSQNTLCIKRANNFMGKVTFFIQKIENSKIGLLTGRFIFLAAVFLRNIVETRFSHTPYRFNAFFFHFPLFYLAIVLFIITLLSFLTREKVGRVAKIVALFIFIIIIPPLIDYLVTGGKGFAIEYIRGEPRDWLIKFFTFGGPFTQPGISYGLRIEIFLVMIGVFLYILFKTQNWVKSLLGFFLTYLFIFFIGVYPTLIKKLFVSFHRGDLDHSAIFLLIIIPELFLLFYLWSFPKLKALFSNIRLERVAHYWFMLFAGVFAAGLILKTYPLGFMGFLSSSLALTSVLAAWLVAVLVNDITDLPIDRLVHKERPLSTAALTQKDYYYLIFVLSLLALISAYVVNKIFLVSLITVLLLALIYSLPPIRLKKFPFLSSFTIAFVSFAIFVGGYNLFSSSFQLPPNNLSYLIILSFGLAVNFKDIEDITGDKEAGTLTLPVLLGEKKGKMLIGFLLFLAFLLVPLFLKLSFLWIPSIAAGLVGFWLINLRDFKEKYIFWLYFIYIIVLMTAFFVIII